MRPPVSIATARLRLRPPRLADAQPLFDGYAQDPQVTEFLTWSPHTSVVEIESFLRRCVSCWAKASAFPWVIDLDTDQAAIGMFEMRISRSSVDFGYVLAREHWGNGYMTEVVSAVGDWVLAQPELHRYWAVCDIENLASRRVLEKAGLTLEGVLRRWLIHPAKGTTPRDCFCYARVRDGA